MINSENVTQVLSQSKKDNIISDLVSELFNHIDSKDSFDFISELLPTSLSIYKKKFEFGPNSLDHALNLKINNTSFNKFQQNLSDVKSEYLAISNDIHSILSNCPDLSSDQKLDYCNSQRYFMKMYLKEMVIKLEDHQSI